MSNVVRLVPPPPASTAPRGLSKAARAEWDRLAPMLRARGTLTPENEPLLGAYVGAVALIAEIDRELNKRGTRLTIKGPGGVPRVHPLIGARNKASQNALQFAKRLGIIGSGAPVPASNQGAESDDPLTRLGV